MMKEVWLGIGQVNGAVVLFLKINDGWGKCSKFRAALLSKNRSLQLTNMIE